MQRTLPDNRAEFANTFRIKQTMDRFDAMRLFTRVVERRSFTLAAQDLAVPRSTATDVIKELETRLGVRLLQRTTRAVRPTLDGEAYYARCLALIGDIEDAESAFTGGNPRGLLRIDVHGILARHFLLPGLPAFLERYPEIELYMGEGDRLVDLVREGIDCVLRVGTPASSDMVARRVGLLREATLASAAYVQRHGLPTSIDELHEGHRMIGFRSSATGQVMPLEFVVGGELRTITLPASLSVNGAESYGAAARLGLGIIQKPRYDVEDELRSGALIEILPASPPSPSPVSLLYPKNRQLSPRVRVFIDWLAQEFAARGSIDEG
jgi:DNA-binding transcriptional LysR family regulator